ncbi:MAG: hypothetical protein KDC12_01200 [Flavobacteriales bacterium]|nr:hypothetical protein [Flavobacteriales bacterium]
MSRIKLLIALFAICGTSAFALLEIEGCTYPLACNYDPLATVHIDVCDWESCAGCTYPDATNYDPSAILENYTCIFSYTNGLLGDLNQDDYVGTPDLLLFLPAFDDICEWIPNETCEGWMPSTDNCMSHWACNFNPYATYDDGSCYFEDCFGCTFACAYNYDPCARVDDGTCIFLPDNPCVPTGNCAADLNNSGNIDTYDLLLFLGAFGDSL